MATSSKINELSNLLKSIVLQYQPSIKEAGSELTIGSTRISKITNSQNFYDTTNIN